MHDVAGVVIGDSLAHRAERATERLGGQELREVAHPGGEARRPLPPRGVVGEQCAVGLHVGAAARRVHHDRVHVRRLEHLDRALGEGDGEIVLARVGMERTAAGLRARRHDLRAVSREHAGRGPVLRAESDLLDAAGEHTHACPPGAVRGCELGKRSALPGGRQRGKKRLPVGERRGQELEETGGARKAPEPAHLIEAEARRGQAEQARPRQEHGKVHPAEEAAQWPPGTLPLDLRPGGLDELAIGDAGGTHRLAGATAETQVEVRYRGVAQLEPPFRE